MELSATRRLDRVVPQVRGLLVYAGHNKGEWKAFAYYKNGASQQTGYTLSKPAETTTTGRYRYSVIMRDGSGKAGVGAAKSLNKAIRNPVVDLASGAQIGYFAWEILKMNDGTNRARPDSTGEFQVIAKTFKRLFVLDNSLVKPFANVHDDLEPEGTEENSRENFFDALEECHENALDFFAYAGHGNKNSLGSAQVGVAHLDRLKKEMLRLLKPNGVVVFYACMTGKPAGFASKLSGMLPTMTVWGHSDSGQASLNADKYRYRNGLGEDIRQVISGAARAKFGKYLLKNPDFYARIPFLTTEQMEAELTA